MSVFILTTQPIFVASQPPAGVPALGIVPPSGDPQGAVGVTVAVNPTVSATPVPTAPPTPTPLPTAQPPAAAQLPGIPQAQLPGIPQAQIPQTQLPQATQTAFPTNNDPTSQPNHNSVDVAKRLIDSPLQDIQWITDTAVIVLSEKGVVYLSLDGGRSWVNQMRKFTSGPAGQQRRTSRILSINVSPVDPSYIFFVATAGLNWATKDMMKSLAPSDLVIRDIRMHGAQPEWMLASSMSEGCASGGKSSSNTAFRGATVGGTGLACYKTLHVSQDFGKTWRHALSYIVQFDWAPSHAVPKKKGASQVGTTHNAPPITPDDSIIYATVHDTQAGNQRFGFWDKDIHFVESRDFFRTMRVLVPHGNRFLMSDHAYLFVATVNPLRELEVTLQISRDNTSRLDFQQALIPVQLTEHSYTILDTSEETVFLHVNHRPFAEKANSGHVYISDWTGLVYSLSLPYNQRDKDGKCDFEKVEGLEGVYLANFLDIDERTLDAERSSSRSRSRTKSTSKAMTVITFDKGAVWSYLVPPTVDSLGKQIPCDGQCHLHLHGITDLYGPFYSSANAPGLIMGTGSVSSHLLSKPGLVNTYLSRDAGYSWSEVAKGSFIYEFGDHGGLLVMAKDEAPTTEIRYSWDQGRTWTKIRVFEEPFQIENIIIEPSSTALQFIVYGWKGDAGVMIYLDFANLHERECQGHDAPDTGASDYERWTPSDGRLGEKCLLGRRVTYTRRKSDRSCYNPEEHETRVDHDHCGCTLEDFQCDYGYERVHEGTPLAAASSAVTPGMCVKSARDPFHKDPSTFGREDTCDVAYRVTKGYRRIPGNSCLGGAQWDAVMAPCPGWMSGGRAGKMVLVVILLLVVAMGLVSLGNNSDVMERLWYRVRRFWSERGYNLVGGGGPRRHGKNAGTDDNDRFYINEDEFEPSATLIKSSPPPKPVTSGNPRVDNSSMRRRGREKDSDEETGNAGKDEEVTIGPLLTSLRSPAAVPKLRPPE